MPITAKQSEVKFELVPAGNHLARCYSMIEIGTEDIVFNGETKQAYKVRITWELPNEKKVFNPEKGEQPFSVSKDYTLSMHEKANLRHDLSSWRGRAFTDDEAKAFDITKLIGIPCMLNVIHNAAKNGNTYANISSVATVPKGLIVPPQINPSFIFSYDDWNDSKFNALPDYLRQRIERTPQFKKRLEVDPNPAERGEFPDIEREPVGVDDLPF